MAKNYNLGSSSPITHLLGGTAHSPGRKPREGAGLFHVSPIGHRDILPKNTHSREEWLLEEDVNQCISSGQSTLC